MCGFSGFFGGCANLSKNDGERLLQSMNREIYARGPDDEGYWFSPEQNIYIGHRRLSIIDLSLAGHQPMHSTSGRYIIAFNGEIYNHAQIRQELTIKNNNFQWRGHSDTETLLAGFEQWGIQNTIERSIGMFAFSVWDRKKQILTLGRDRMGEKPLYYGWQKDSFLFGSELKAIKKHPSFGSEINLDAATLFLRHGYVPAPYSIYKNIYKLEPGCLLTVSLARRDPQIIRYWSLIDTALSCANNPFNGSAIDAVDQLEILAKDAIQQQLISDVPLGAFLSGGVDSSTIVALMQSQSSRPIKTFSIGFHEDEYDESKYARLVAKHLKTDHTELYVTPKEAINVIPELSSIYCEPFADSSQIPTFLVSKLARKQVTVSLSGDGGDELFCGYNRYPQSKNLWRKLNKVPRSIRYLMSKSLSSIPINSWNNLSDFLPNNFQVTGLGDKLHKASEILSFRSFNQFYRDFHLSNYRNPESLVLEGRELHTHLVGNQPDLSSLDDMQQMMALDQIFYLPDDILVKVDRASMRTSLETRVPLLDHRIVEFSWSLPQTIKYRDGQSKWPLRQILNKHVPQKLIDRPKSGFSIPMQFWLRGPLRDWAEDLLNERRLSQEGIFNPGAVRMLWLEHQSGKRNWTQILWNIIMFQAWLEEN